MTLSTGCARLILVLFHVCHYDSAMDEASKPAPAQGTNARPPLQWRAHEYVHTEKTTDWYWALGLIAVAGAVGAVLLNNVLFALFILISSFVLAVLASQKPKHIEFAVTQRGVRIDKTLYPYSSLESFAVDQATHTHTPKLILESKKMFAPKLVIPLIDVDPDEVHGFLSDFLVEDDHIEPFTDRFMEWLGF